MPITFLGYAETSTMPLNFQASLLLALQDVCGLWLILLHSTTDRLVVTLPHTITD